MIVITDELEELKAQAEGRRPFVENETYESLAALEQALRPKALMLCDWR